MDYRLRVSRRARRLWLKVTGRGELEVVVPRGYDLSRIPAIVLREQAWIQAARARVERRRLLAPPPAEWRIPDRIELPALGAGWGVTARPTAQPGVRVRPLGRQGLELVGQVADLEACRQACDRFLVRQARAHLLPRLAVLSRTLALPYSAASVRLQRTRWGSCSGRGAVSLNARLLLLPPRLVDYVLIHELCHTRVPSHSARFWGLLARHCPEAARLRAELRAAGRALPDWARERGDGSCPGAD